MALSPRSAKQIGTGYMPVSSQQRARERRRAIAVSAAALCVIAGTLATIVLVRANNRDDDTYAVASLTSPEKAALPAKASDAKPEAKTPPVQPEPAKAVQAAETKTAAVPATPPVTETVGVALNTKDPRWINKAAKVAVAQDDDAAVGEQGDAGRDFTSEQPTGNAAEKAIEQAAGEPSAPELTSAIPTPKPDISSEPAPAKPAKAAAKQANAADAAAKGGGQILRDVTMRVSGSKNAAQVGTIPAGASVGLIQCKQWCQVTYKGKTGWIYKSFVSRGG